jgi:hypothetical protein
LASATASLSSQLHALSFGPKALEDGLHALTPTKFEMKILQAYVVEDVDATTSNNVGKVSRIWVHEDCADPNNCKPADVSYFDLTDPTAANAALNSQARSVDAGTYRYVRLDFCVGSSETPNVRFSYGGNEFEKTYGGCGVTSSALPSPVELRDGSSVTIQLSYDLTDGEIYYADSSSTCTTSAPCLGSIDLVPSIVQ